jgi:hypothetical protein
MVHRALRNVAASVARGEKEPVSGLPDGAIALVRLIAIPAIPIADAHTNFDDEAPSPSCLLSFPCSFSVRGRAPIAVGPLHFADFRCARASTGSRHAVGAVIGGNPCCGSGSNKADAADMAGRCSRYARAA